MTEIQSAAADRQSREEIAAKERDMKRSENAKQRKFESRENVKKNLTSIAGALTKALNDKSWYNKSPQLVKDVAQVSFLAPQGTNIGSEDVAQLFVAHYAPTLPHTSGGTLATHHVDETLATAFKALYAKIRKANSGARNYEYQDLIKYSLMIQSMYETLAYFRRVYTLAMKFDPNSKLFGNNIFEILNIDINNIRSNLPGLRATLNYYGNLLKVYSLPDSFSVVTRHVWMNSSIFKDHNMAKTQYYMFDPIGYYVNDNPTNTSLAFHPFTHYLGKRGIRRELRNVDSLNMTQITDVLDSQFNGLVTDPYAGIISGDIRKAITGSYLEFPDVTEKDTVNVVYSEEVLQQIENSQFLDVRGTAADKNYMQNLTETFSISQDTAAGTIDQGLPILGIKIQGATDATIDIVTKSNGFENVYLNSYLDNPTPDDIMVSTRLSQPIEILQSTKTDFFIGCTTFGTEYLLNYDLAFMTNNEVQIYNDQTLLILDDSKVLVNDRVPGAWQYDTELLPSLGALSQFDWSPKKIWGTFVADVQDIVMSWSLNFLGLSNFELKNYARVDHGVLRNMNRVAALSEYGLVDFSKD